jgi:hypothetical protein
MNEQVGPKRESPKEDCGAWPLRRSLATPNRTLCGAADVVDVPPGAAFLSSDPEDVPSVAVFPSAGAPFETSWYHVPLVAVFLLSDVEDVPSVAVVVSAMVALYDASWAVGLFEAGSWTGLSVGGRRARATCNVASSALTSLRRSGMRRARTTAMSSRRVSAVESTRAITTSRRVLCASDVCESWSSKPLWVRSRASSAARAVV